MHSNHDKKKKTKKKNTIYYPLSEGVTYIYGQLSISALPHT